jgi:hypothetical protein
LAKPDKRPSQPLPNIISTGALGKIGDKKALFQQMAAGGRMGMGGARMGPRASASIPQEKPVQIEHTRNEGDTVNIINNIQVAKTTKKKPKKVNFQ